MKDVTRVLAVVALVAVLLIPTPYFMWLKDELVLMLLGTVAIVVLVLWDAATGFILALALLAGMYRIHINALNVFGWISSNQDHGHSLRTKSLFTTADHLERAQSNVVDKKNFGVEMVGIQGVYGEAVYGAQGITANADALPGFEPVAMATESNYVF
jgi:hypothetical protein